MAVSLSLFGARTSNGTLGGLREKMENMMPITMSPSERVLIRSAGIEDAATISQMVGELADYERLADHNSATPETIAKALSLESGRIEVILAEIDGQAVGFAAFFTTYSTFAAKPGIYLEDLFVKPDLRHQGIGGRLLGEVARIAHERDCGRMEWTTLLWNTEAIEFYEGLGARPNDAWITYRLSESNLEALGAAAAARNQ